MDQQYQQYWQGQNQQPVSQQQPVYQQQYQQQYQQPIYQAPAQQLPTDRNVVVVILLSLVTFGIYGLVLQYQLIKEINLTAARDGKKTTGLLAMILLSCITFGIYGIVWTHMFAERVGAEAARRNTGISFGAVDFWIYSVLLSFTVICPLIYKHKLLQATNAINTSYNIYG